MQVAIRDGGDGGNPLLHDGQGKLLPLHRRRQLVRDRADLGGHAGNRLEGAGGIGGQRDAVLDDGPGVGDHLRRALGGLRAFGGQLLHLVGHHREALPGRPGPGGLHGGVEGEYVGLEGDVADVLGDLGDLLGVVADVVHGGGEGGHLLVRALDAAGDLLRLGAGLPGAVRHGGQTVLHVGHLVDQGFGGLVLLQGGMVELGGLAAQPLRHGGEPVRGGAEAQEGFVHGLGDGVQAAPDQHKIALIVHLGPGAQVAVRHPGQHLLDVGYVPVHALQGGVQGVGHQLQLIPGAHREHLGVQIAAGEGHHPVGDALHRVGDGAGKPQNQQDGDGQARQGGQDGHQHGPVNEMAVVRLGDLDHQRPLGPPDGGERHQHPLPAEGVFRGPRLSGGDPLHRVPAAAAELLQRGLAEGQGLVGVAGDDALPVDHVGPPGLSQVDAADDVVQQVVFIDAHQVQGGFAVRLHRDPHGDAQPALKEGGGIGGQIVRFLQQREKRAVRSLRRAVDALDQPPVQIVQGDGVKLVQLRRLLQHRRAACRRFPRGGGFPGHPGIDSDAHHAVGQHMDIGLHGFGGLPGHGLKAVQQDAVGKRLQGSSHNHAAYDHQNQDIEGGVPQNPPIQAPFHHPADAGVRSLSRHVPVAPFFG